MSTPANDKRKAALAFADSWAGRGYEKGDAQVFWTELLRDVVGMQRVSAVTKFEHRTADGGFIDVFIPDAGVLVEQKSLGVDLDTPELRQGQMVTPFEQARAYIEIMEAREKLCAALIASQLEPNEWYFRIEGKLTADSILNRIAAARYIDLEGPNMREYFAKKKPAE